MDRRLHNLLTGRRVEARKFRHYIQDRGDQLVAAQPGAILSHIDENTRSARFIISTRDKDRTADIMEPRGCRLENYAKNPVVLYNHISEKKPMPVGIAEYEGRLFVDVFDDRVESVCFFHDKTKLAREAWDLVSLKIIRATSIGFLATKFEQNDDGEGLHVHEWDLLEWSLVITPCNPNCSIVARDYLARTKDLTPFTRHQLERIAVPLKVFTNGWTPRKKTYTHEVQVHTLNDEETRIEGRFKIDEDARRIEWISGEIRELPRSVQATIFRTNGDNVTGNQVAPEDDRFYQWHIEAYDVTAPADAVPAIGGASVMVTRTDRAGGKVRAVFSVDEHGTNLLTRSGQPVGRLLPAGLVQRVLEDATAAHNAEEDRAVGATISDGNRYDWEISFTEKFGAPVNEAPVGPEKPDTQGPTKDDDIALRATVYQVNPKTGKAARARFRVEGDTVQDPDKLLQAAWLTTLNEEVGRLRIAGEGKRDGRLGQMGGLIYTYRVEVV